jgi:hypothetical protein
LKLTTLAIIGGGIAGRSLIYALAKKKKNFSKITLFDSESFAPACSLRSTAIVANRGVTLGHSALGDLLFAGHKTFSQHVQSDSPTGVFSIKQYSATTKNIDQFKLRYPNWSSSSAFGDLKFNSNITVAHEEAFLIDPPIYLDWLTNNSPELNLETRREFVVQVQKSAEGVELTDQSKKSYHFDKVIFCGGSYNRFWDSTFTGRPVHGSYFEFSDIDFKTNSFSLTLDSDNLIYHAHSKKLLIGSTTQSNGLILGSRLDLENIYQRLQGHLAFDLPALDSSSIVITGLREKAAKRAPYVVGNGPCLWMGGFYKNGFSLGLHLSQELIESFL